MRRAPGFTLTVTITLALSVGIATAVFCVIDAVILRPLPYVHPERIVDLQSLSRSKYVQPASWPSFVDERAQAQSFQALAGYSTYSQAVVVTPSGAPVKLPEVRGTDNFFDVFGVRPLLGRTFLPGEEQDGKNDIAVLSYSAWQGYFDGDRGIVNRSVTLNGRSFTVVGVMPAGFRFPLSTRNAIYIPIHLDQWWMNGRGNHWLQSIARLKPGVSIEQAQADLDRVFANIGHAYPGTDAGRTVHLAPLAQSTVRQTKGPLWTLFGAVLAVLAIGCVNVAGLLLARGVRREREMAVRTAIGAKRAMLVRQLLAEGMLLALSGAAGGVVVAWSMLRLMHAFLIKALSRGADIHLDWTVLAVAIALAVTASLLASLLPAIRLSAVDPNRALKAGAGSGTQRAQHRLRSGFIVTQVALTMVLLVVSGLLIRVVTRYRHADLGFDPAHILAVQVDLSRVRYEGRDMLTSFYQPLEERVSHIPGVRAAGFINLLPIDEYGSNSDLHIAGQPPYPPNQEMLAENRVVSRGYFDVMGIPLLAGRALSPSLDRPENAAPTVVVNSAFVKKFIPAGLNPVAQRIDDADKQENWTSIIGVVGNVRQDIFEPPLAERDWLMNEIALKARGDLFSTMFLLVRTDGDPMLVVPAVRAAVHDLDPTVPLNEPRSMTAVVSEALVFDRLESWLFGIFASLALALALVGLYGLVSHEVEQSTRDIGVRMALGATRPSILTLVLERVAGMLGVGAIAGLALAVAARKLIGIVIYFDAQKEFANLAAMALFMVAAGLLAALIPARRAASIEPMQALRNE